MAGRIPPEFIDQLLSRVDIVDIIDKRVPLKKAGREFQACCPFHTEKTPSFTVSQQKQFYHCFGCGAHGTAIGFLIEYDHLGFVEAVEELSRDAGLEIPREAGSARPAEDHSQLYQLLEQANMYFQNQLRQHPQAQLAIDYLKNRGLTGDIARDFGIGFAPSGWDNLVKSLATQPSLLKPLQMAGLISVGDSGKHYDRFRDRIMFPILDTRGRVVGFGGRVINDSTPKYLNSPETPVFHKGAILYGLYQLRHKGAGKRGILVVEGYMDVVALAQFGIHNAVATLGTATTSRHLEQLFRTTSKVIFCFDGDRAGRDAAWKALKTALPVMKSAREARFLFLPEGEDPDTLVREKGADYFHQLMNDAPTLSEYLFQHLAQDIDTTTLDGRARLADLAKPLIDQIPAGSLHDLLLKQLSHLTGLEVSTQSAQHVSRPLKRRRQQVNNTPVRYAIRLLLESPKLALLSDLPLEWKQAQAKGIDLLASLLEISTTNPHITTAALIDRWPDDNIKQHLSELAASVIDIPEEGLEAEFTGSLSRLAEQYRKQQLHLLLQQPLDQLTDEQKQQLKRLYSKQEHQDISDEFDV